MGDDAANISHLRDPIGVIPQVFADQLIGGLSVALAGHFQLEIAGVELEQMLQQFLVGHVGAVDRIDITARANMNADILALLCRKAIEDPIVEFYKERQKVTRGPRIARVVTRGQTPLREVHDDVCSAGIETGTDIFLTFVDDIILKLLARIAWYIAVELIEQIHHGRRNHSLMERLAGHSDWPF